MQQKDGRVKEADHGRFPFRISKIKKNTYGMNETRSFGKLDGILKIKRFEDGNVKRAHKTS